MRCSDPSIQVRRVATACVAVLLNVSAALAAEPPKPGTVSVLDEACVERRAQMCLRLADPDSSAAVESTFEKLCSSLVCERGWYRTDLWKYGKLGPLCVCERRYVEVAEGGRCAEGFREVQRAGPDGRTRITCELPDLKMDQYQGFQGYQAGWYWPATPWDLMTCLQYARFGPGSGACRKSVPEK